MAAWEISDPCYSLIAATCGARLGGKVVNDKHEVKKERSGEDGGECLTSRPGCQMRSNLK